MSEDKAEVVTVIKTTLGRRGKGTEGSPLRVVTQYWSFAGELLAERDPLGANMVAERMAKAIYEYLPYDGPGCKPPWVENGNSTKQEACRRIVRNAAALD